MSGVLFIEQVLLNNGYIDEFSGSNPDTICVYCGKIKKEHKKEQLDITGGMGGTGNTGGMDGTGGGDSDIDHDTCINIIKKGNDFKWVKNEQIMLIAKKMKIDGKNKYYIPASGLDNKLINAQSHALRDLSMVLDDIHNHRIVFQVPDYAPRLGEWLLHLGFKYSHKKDKYSYLEYKPKYAGGNRGTGDKDKEEDNKEEDKGEEDKENTDDTENTENTENTDDTENKKHHFYKLASEIDNTINSSINGGKIDNKRIVKYRTNSNSNTNTNTSTNNPNHKFTPVRFVMAHSEIDRAQIEHSLEKFNGPDNTDGSRFLILVGSKIIKESYDTKAIRNEFIMGRPDNISTLIQIKGRAVRKNSHKLLPLDQRHVKIFIFTSCLPIKQKSGVDTGAYQLSYEEEKYKEKIAAFQVMQKIEKVLFLV
jgi:hypothetical protein